MTNPITTGGTLPSVGYVGPDGTGMATGGQPLPFQLPAPPAPFNMPEILEAIKAIAPGIMQALSRRSDATDERAWQEADAARRDSRAQALERHSAAIANLAHALGDMKETKARVETTGALEQAISRLASACVPVVEEKEPSDGLEDDERAFVLECLRAFAEEEPRDDEDRSRVAQAAAIFDKLCAGWRMRFVPKLAVETVNEETSNAG